MSCNDIKEDLLCTTVSETALPVFLFAAAV